MRLILNEEQEHLASTARSFVTSSTPIDRVRKLRDSKDPVGFSRALWKQMADLGWTGICLPEEYGGLGLGVAELAITDHVELRAAGDAKMGNVSADAGVGWFTTLRARS